MIKSRAFSLVETLIVMMTLPVVFFITTQLFRIYAQEMPRGQRITEEHTTVLHLLEQLSADMHTCRNVRLDPPSDAHTLTIETGHQTWIYRKHEGEITRSTGIHDPNSRHWPLPQAEIRWSLIEPYPDTRALRVDSGIKAHYQTHTQPRTYLANTRLLFLSPSHRQEVTP